MTARDREGQRRAEKYLPLSSSEVVISPPLWAVLPGEGNGNLLQYSCLENPMDGGAW